MSLPPGRLTTALLSLPVDENNHQQHFYDAAGVFRISWATMKFNEEQITLACLVPEEKAIVAASALTVQEPPIANIAMDDTNTETLLQQALDTCQTEQFPLSIALMPMVHVNGLPLHQVDNTLWTSVGKKLRSLYRMSDLIGVNDNGDFVVIFVGSNADQAKSATKRIMGHLEEWAPIHNILQLHLHEISYVTWCPHEPTVTAQELLASLGVTTTI